MIGPRWSLEKKVALVTGGSRGLGSVIATALARRGATVVIASRRLDACEAAAAEIAATTGASAAGVAYHTGRWEESDRLVADLIERFGRIDVLVNNAGMSPVYESLLEVTEELFDKVLAVNLRGPFRLASPLGAHMAETGGGSIINVSSVSAVRPSPRELPYAAAEAGLNVVTSGVAQTYGPTVRCNTVMPGYFLTDVSAAWDMDAFTETVAPTIPLGRAGDPDEVADLVVYLATDASSYVTGSVFTIDGGLAA